MLATDFPLSYNASTFYTAQDAGIDPVPQSLDGLECAAASWFLALEHCFGSAYAIQVL